MTAKRLLFTSILIIALVCTVNGQQTSTFFVPDSIISLSSQKEVDFEGKVFGMPLWETLPDSAIKQTKDEWLENRTSDRNEFGVNRAAWYVQTPSLLFFPAGKDTLHPAVVIFPGGGYKKVVLDKEGIDVAQRLNQSGISAVVVKYRSLSDMSIHYRNVPDSIYNTMYSDARQAVKVVREKAASFNFDPDKIGIMGFSAGGALAANLLIDTKSEPSDSDADFGCLTYPVLYDTVLHSVSENTPPTFLVSTKDDGSAPAADVQEYYDSLQVHGVEAEFQLFDSGGHGYGLGVKGGDVTQWPGMFVSWLEKNDILLTSIDNNFESGHIKLSGFELYDCYPNPFNPSTSISYRLHENQNVTIKIFDISGKEIETVFQGNQLTGQHKIEWSAKDTASGTYFVQMNAGAQSSSKKLVLIK